MKMLALLGSRKLTIGTLAALLALLLALVTFPQSDGPASSPAAPGVPAWAGLVEILGLNKVVRSPLFLVVITLFYLNLSVLLWRRFFRSRELDRETLGMVVMHGAIYFFLLGGLYTWHGRFDGTLLLTEGQAFANELRASGYNRYLAAGGDQHGWRVSLLALEETRDFRGTLTDLRARLQVADNDGAERTVESRINYPADVSGLSFYIRKYGIAPKLTVTTAAGEPVFDAYVNLDLLGGRVDDIPLETSGLRLRAAQRGAEEAGLWLACQQADGGYSAPVFMEQGGRMALPDGRTLHVGEIRRWVAFDVSRDPGFVPIVVGSLLLMAGMTIRLFPRAWLPAGTGRKLASDLVTSRRQQDIPSSRICSP